MKLKFAPTLQNDINVQRWRQIEIALSRLIGGLIAGCLVGSYIYGALVGGA